MNCSQHPASLYHFAPLECSIVFVPSDYCDSGLLILKHCGGLKETGGNSLHCYSFDPAHTKYCSSCLLVWLRFTQRSLFHILSTNKADSIIITVKAVKLNMQFDI